MGKQTQERMNGHLYLFIYVKTDERGGWALPVFINLCLSSYFFISSYYLEPCSGWAGGITV